MFMTHLFRQTSLTEYGEVSGRYGVVVCSWCCRPAQIRAAVLSFNGRDNQVPVSQHSGSGHVYGFRVGPAPGHKRPRVALRQTLQNHRLTQPGADVLRSCYDVWFHERPRTQRWTENREDSGASYCFLYSRNGSDNDHRSSSHKHRPGMMVSSASWLLTRLAMFVAKQRYLPASLIVTSWICSTPFGKTVILKQAEVH